MKNLKRAILASLILAACCATGADAAGDFTADMTTDAGGSVFTGKLYVSKDKMRMEMPMAVTITRIDTKKVFILMPEQKMYMEQPFDPRKTVGAADKVPGETKREPLGEEPVGGVPADKYRISYTLNGETSAVIQWVDKKTGVALKTAAEDGSWQMELSNVKTGPLDGSLFEIPADYTALPSMPGMTDMQDEERAER
ncbi:MAG TPA: DUF4412 domain-containing protein [bacterium]|nr:DUF4412 domain-containing protein [bacterium]